jgi:hypothetical protein
MFTHDEARTLITFWAIFRSPLMIGANLPASDAYTLSLLTNPEVIAVDQHSSGNHPVIQTDQVLVWAAHREDGHGEYLAFVSISDQPQKIAYRWEDLGLARKVYRVRDLWLRRNLGDKTELTLELPPHASKLYEVE